ncbi:unnamed protein product, partial [Polarella glacialis]
MVKEGRADRVGGTALAAACVLAGAFAVSEGLGFASPVARSGGPCPSGAASETRGPIVAAGTPRSGLRLRREALRGAEHPVARAADRTGGRRIPDPLAWSRRLDRACIVGSVAFAAAVTTFAAVRRRRLLRSGGLQSRPCQASAAEVLHSAATALPAGQAASE